MSNKKKVFLAIQLATFLMFIALPTLLINANDTVDVSIIFSVAEEENKESKKDLGAKAKLPNLSSLIIFIALFKDSYSIKPAENYLIPLLSKSSPPPRHLH